LVSALTPIAPLYQSTPQQLCVNYLIGTQLSTGEGLVGRGRHRRSLVRVCGAGVSRYESTHVMCSI
jgi:hypothetical protein